MKKKLAALMPISLAVTDCSSPAVRALPIRSNACLCKRPNMATSIQIRVQVAGRMLCRVCQQSCTKEWCIWVAASRSCLNLLAADGKWPSIVIIQP